MASFLSSGLLVDIAIALLVVECLGLLVLRRFKGAGPSMIGVVAGLVAGGFLLLALRAALVGAPFGLVLVFLALALPAHVVDLVMRWRDPRAEVRPQ